VALRAGIIHRDLKPGNILISRVGAKLLDFGLVRANAPLGPDAETLAETLSITEKGTIVGTLQYILPEQVEGKEADVRSDIFAFGCVLYEMLTGHPAFEGGSKASIIAAILDRKPKELTGATPTLARVVDRCLAK
jgi:serine/threonine protein kinase